MMISDRETVVKKLEECLSASCRGFRTCPYSDADWDAVREALALLKEQEPMEPHVEHDSDDDSWYYGCGECHEAIDYKDKFCRHCGRKVKWNAAD